jgi:alpha-amylase/alpha-mannosidase (GH57 family)
MNRYICIHGHFYQPPRENPWLEAVELQDSAYPFHDWNERITEECYAPNTASRILDREGRIVDIVNLYSRISFNFGPTLLSWLEAHRPGVYEAVIEADRISIRNFSGHGSAMAQVYNHMIMPLANRQDKVTQVRWGLADFRRRFGREPEGMWLPETAVDTESLEALAAEGLAYTLLAPRQAARVRDLSQKNWTDVGGGRVDPQRPYLCRLPSGRSIAVFFYDGPISQDVAFGGLLNNGEEFAGRLASAFPEEKNGPSLVHIATDGETYGHHHRGGDMALAYCLHHIESSGIAKLTNYGAYLERHPPTAEVEIVENSSWSCVHGIERWRAGCGCQTGANPGWQQNWRTALREAVNRLGNRASDCFGREGAQLFRDPWEARDGYMDVFLAADREKTEAFLTGQAAGHLDEEKRRRALKLLEMQRNAQLSYTSCGWFFDDIGGIEAVQVMMYAARAMQYISELGGGDVEEEFKEILAKGKGNREADGAVVYAEHVEPASVDFLRVGAHYGISSLFEDYPERTSIYTYTFERSDEKSVEAGKVRLLTGRIRTVSERTWEERDLFYAVLHLGDQNISGGVRDYAGGEDFAKMQGELTAALERGDVMGGVRLMDDHFGKYTFSAWHLFRDEQRRVLNEVLALTYDGIEASYRQIYENSHALMSFLQTMKMPLPHPLLVTAEYVLDRDLHNVVCKGDLDLDELERITADIKRWNVRFDRLMLGYHANARINSLMERWRENVGDTEPMKDVLGLLAHLKTLGVEPDLWKAQNIYFLTGRKVLSEIMARDGDEPGDERAAWLDIFRALGRDLGVRTE